jgi:hypothetical protein
MAISESKGDEADRAKAGVLESHYSGSARTYGTHGQHKLTARTGMR